LILGKPLQASPAKLVFGRDAIMNTKFGTNWRLNKKTKQKNQSNCIEKKKKNDSIISIKLMIVRLVKANQVLQSFGKPYEIDHM
jgi:hypothetical protein